MDMDMDMAIDRDIDTDIGLKAVQLEHEHTSPYIWHTYQEVIEVVMGGSTGGRMGMGWILPTSTGYGCSGR